MSSQAPSLETSFIQASQQGKPPQEMAGLSNVAKKNNPVCQT